MLRGKCRKLRRKAKEKIAVKSIWAEPIALTLVLKSSAIYKKLLQTITREKKISAILKPLASKSQQYNNLLAPMLASSFFDQKRNLPTKLKIHH